jgi:outer membrane protein TolC
MPQEQIMKAKKSLPRHKSTFLLLAMSASMYSVAIAAPSKPSVTSDVSSASPTVAEASANPAPLSLVEVLAYALDHNPQRQAAWYAAKAAKARIGTAAADGGLQVNLNGSASNQWGFGSVGTFNPGNGGIGGSNSNGQGWRESLSADATYPLYTGGKVKASKKVASYNYQQAVAQAIGTEQDLVFNTTLDYLSILRNQQLVDVNQTNLDVAKERDRIANVRFNAGAAAKLEVFQADAAQATAQQNLVEAQNSLKQSYANLNTIMGRQPQTPLQIVPIDQLTLPKPLIANSAQLGKSTFTQGNLSGNSNVAIAGTALATPNTSTSATSTGSALSTSPTSNAANSTTTNMLTNSTTNSAGASPVSSPSNVAATSQALMGGQQLAQMANGSSPTLAALQAQVLAAEASVNVAKSAKKPKLGLSLSGLISNPVSYLGRFILSLGGSLVQNLFDSGRTTSEVRTAQATVMQLKSSLQNGELSVANQIEQSLLALNSAKEREVTTKSAVTSAQEALRAAQLGYSAGVQTSLDVSDAEAALLTAQTNAVNAKFDVAASQAQLAAAVGVLTAEGQTAYNKSVPIEKVIDKKGK